jgi:hypothetical protein
MLSVVLMRFPRTYYEEDGAKEGAEQRRHGKD